MNRREDKKLENFVDSMMAEAPLDSPSFDFTENVLKKIEAETRKEVFQYKPILSKTAMFTVFTSFVALLVFVWLKFGLDSGQGWFKNFQIQEWFQNSWGWKENYTSAKTMMYAFLFFGLMFFVQVPWLKKQLNRTVF
ncbi:MAG: hypothetical protein CMH46_15255 [Muricauda sp.]|nr:MULTISPECIES: hypothetical protein [unclassified Allomuricauda]MAU16885.1 hypothetical protein [Allomuricauda sp.]|tara:strand:- start:20654 stop:21064 length:411 start_codon:yes stop_codon:yes gene_type:complete